MKQVVFVLFAFSLWAAVPADDIDPKSLECKLSISTPAYLAIANASLELSQRVDGVPKIILQMVHHGMKGSADILNALPGLPKLSSEAWFQLNANCDIASRSIEATFESVKAQYPDFAEKHRTELNDIEQIAVQLGKDIVEKC